MQVQRLEFLGSRQAVILPENILLPTAAHTYKAEVISVTKGLKMLQEQGDRVFFSILVVPCMGSSFTSGPI